MKRGTSLAIAGLTATTIALSVLLSARARQIPTPEPTPIPLVTGKTITPIGAQTNVGSYPCNMVLSPNGKYLLVSSLGARSRITVLSATDGKVVSQADFNGPHPTAERKNEGLFYGLAFGTGPNNTTLVYASRGSDERVSVLTLTEDGKITRTDREILVPGGASGTMHVAGIAANLSGSQLYATNNIGDPKKEMKGQFTILDTATGQVRSRITVPGYPFGVAAITAGPAVDQKVYVTSEQRGTVSVVDARAGKVLRDVPTGANATALLLNKKQDRLFVANSGSDTVSILKTDTDAIEKTILLRPADARGLPSATPLGMALSPDEKTLYIALADLNAVAVVDFGRGSVRGYIPVGWYPTAVTVSPDGERLFVANAKGIAVRNSNDRPAEVAGGGNRARYIQNIIEGTVSTIVLDGVDPVKETARVVANNRIQRDLVKVAQRALKNPGIEHVIYIIKENRTYDQVLSDLPQGNGDKSLLMFGRDITPNQHALVERFVLLDNFYCSAEVSGDGWNWSTQGMANEYNSRNVVYGYTGKNRTYDYEGTNNGVRIDLEGIPDVSTAPGGYIWDKCAQHKVSYRNYGFFSDDATRTTPEEGVTSVTPKVESNKKALVGKTAPDFRQYDTNYADSEAWIKHGLAPAPRQMKSFGKHNDPARMTAWLREFNEFVKNKNLPRFQMVRLGRDHTAGTTAGQYSPRAMVADNDYAVGQLVEAVSKSPYWKKTAIFIVEDDAQNGYDHVDAHRSIAFVISPYIRKGNLDSRFYNTDSTLRTMELLLGLSPMNLYDAIAPPLAVFTDKPENDAPYEAILPAKEIIGEVNQATAYRSKDSERLLNPLVEESLPDEELNDILWHSIKGRDVPAPERRYSLRLHPDEDDD